MSEENILAVVLGVATVIVGLGLVFFRRSFEQALRRLQDSRGAGGRRIEDAPWATLVVGASFIGMGVLLALSGLTDGFGTRS